MWWAVVVSGDRSPRTIDFGSGLTYERIALEDPRQVLHVASADLNNPCLGLITTRPGLNGLVAAETGTEFVERTGATLSVNAAFFYPFDEYPYWSSYPRSGDDVTAIGPVVIEGVRLGNLDDEWDLGLVMIDGRLSAGVVPVGADFAVPGRSVLVADGLVAASDSPRYARTVVGVDVDTNRLVVVVSDGKQPGYANGSTYKELAEFLLGLGVDEAVEFDGGGSATMAAMLDGQDELLSRPSHQRLPGRQRPVATHLGITVGPACE